MDGQRASLVCTALLVVAALGAATGGASAAQDDALTIQSLEVSPGEPVPGEVVTFSSSIRATQFPVTVDRVFVRNADGEVIASAENLYTLSGGERATVSVDGRLPPGDTHNLEVVVRGTTINGRAVEVIESVSIDVDAVAPNVAIASGEPTADAESELSVAVTNTFGTAMENVKLQLSAPGVEVRGSGFAASLSSGETATFNVTVLPEAAGQVPLEATLIFATGDETRRTVIQTLALDVDELEDAVTTSASIRDNGTIDVRVANHGDVPVDDVELTASVDGERLDRTLLDGVAGHETRSATLDASDLDRNATVDVRVDYTVGIRDGNATTTVEHEVEAEDDETERPGRIRLTGVSVAPEGRTLRISGSASNVGLTQANATVISVVDTEAVTPAAPQRDYYVGPVPVNDFVSFDVYAAVEGNVSTIPLRIEYIVGNETVERVVEVPLGDAAGAAVGVGGPGAAAAQGNGGGGSGGLPVLPAVGVVLVVGAAIFLWRRRG